MTTWPQEPAPQHEPAEEATTMTMQDELGTPAYPTDVAEPSAASSRRISPAR